MATAPWIDPDRSDEPHEDHVVFLDGVSWEDYERLLEMRGDCSAPRISYLQGLVEIMSPSKGHERVKSYVGCLVEAYCLHARIDFVPLGSWTLKERREDRGGEPDECYVFGGKDATVPDLAIEVVWTSGRIDKLDIYRKLGVREVWYWKRSKLTPHALRGDRYEPIDRSEVLPGLDLDLMMRFVDRPTASQAIREFQAALVEGARAAGDPE
jgi:Uma2 family endonuclease